MENRNLNIQEVLFVEGILKDTVEWKKYILQLRTAKIIDLNVKYCLRFLLQEYNYNDIETFGSNMLQEQVIDLDSVPVLISLDLGRNGNLYELDVWKSDFSDISINIFDAKAVVVNRH
ncbi:hypothetical protein M3B46_14725 [Sphingobacterium daejeonense]|uniref:DUF6984 family protein n=1 Tax=Sphingobacterium daejeonense TaxID=371142 RepID=UPI0021A6B3ED|nr:hypothetical protein [Sphingobacterium daejeonense]MCT1532254.1 hypothetical protein [Sphingobacterium daejeonense]